MALHEFQPNPGDRIVIKLPGATLTIDATDDRPALRVDERHTTAPFLPQEVPSFKVNPLEPAKKPVIGAKVRLNPGEFPAQTGSIKSVAGFDNEYWFGYLTDEKPVRLQFTTEGWCSVSMTDVDPIEGDLVMTTGRSRAVQRVVGEAAVGGWIVVIADNLTCHIMRSGANRWRFMQEAEVTP